MFGHQAKKLAVASAVAIALVSVVPSGAEGAGGVTMVANSGDLSDLAVATADVTDGAQASAFAISRDGDRTMVHLMLSGLNTDFAGMTYGAHVHVGPCVAGSGALAGPHYNSTGGVTVDTDTEVWLDFTVTAGGTAHAAARVPFAISAGGAQSVVIHAMPTAPAGTAGARLACLPLEF